MAEDDQLQSRHEVGESGPRLEEPPTRGGPDTQDLAATEGRAVREGVGRARRAINQLRGMTRAAIHVGDTVAATRLAAEKGVRARTTRAGMVWYGLGKKMELWWENVLPVRIIREARVEAELEIIDDLPPARRDLALYLLDLREGLRQFAVIKNPNGSTAFDYMRYVEDVKRDPKAIFGVKQARAFLRERKNMMDNYSLALTIVRRGLAEVVVRRDGKAEYHTPNDTDGFYDFLNFLSGPEVVTLLRFAGVRGIAWDTDSGTGQTLMSAQTRVPNLEGLVALDRSPVDNFQKGPAGAASLKIVGWGEDRVEILRRVDNWLAGRGVDSHTLRFVGGLSFTESHRKVPEQGLIK